MAEDFILKRVYKKPGKKQGVTDLFRSEGQSLIVDLAEKKTKKALKKALKNGKP